MKRALVYVWSTLFLPIAYVHHRRKCRHFQTDREWWRFYWDEVRTGDNARATRELIDELRRQLDQVEERR